MKESIWQARWDLENHISVPRCSGKRKRLDQTLKQSLFTDGCLFGDEKEGLKAGYAVVTGENGRLVIERGGILWGYCGL